GDLTAGAPSATTDISVVESFAPVVPNGTVRPAIQSRGARLTKQTAEHHAEGKGAHHQPGPLPECPAEHGTGLCCSPLSLKIARQQDAREGLAPLRIAGEGSKLARGKVSPSFKHPGPLLSRPDHVSP